MSIKMEVVNMMPIRQFMIAIIMFTIIVSLNGCGSGSSSPEQNNPTPTSSSNVSPVANAGSAQNVVTGTAVTLDGSASSDANGDKLTYSWSMTSKPTSSSSVLSGATSAKPSFTADIEGIYVISLVVNDGSVNSAAVTVSITASTANAAPVANAGSPQNVITGSLVTLDGSASSDANGDKLTYSWTMTSKPTGSSAALSGATSAKPSFTADIAGTYVISLVVNDGIVYSAVATVSVTVTNANAVPVANAGSAQNVVTGTVVTLDGSASSDANGDKLTYSWTMTSKPTGSSAALSGATSAKPSFPADIAGIYVISLVVNDGTVNSNVATVSITASTGNAAPVANAGSAQNVVTGTVVALDGSASSDANGDNLTYSWNMTSKPTGSSAVLSGATSAKPSFTADIAGIYVISLIVNDGTINSTAATVSISAATGNVAPVANAGPNQITFVGNVVTLDGSLSGDANGDTIVGKWSWVSWPSGSSAILYEDTSINPYFIPDLAGTYLIQLIVFDGQFYSEPSIVIIQAIENTVTLELYGGAGNSTYLGCLSCGSFVSESVCNKFGDYGSAYALNSIWNKYGTYGSIYSIYSPWNSYSISGPAIYGTDGLFYGYFTTNIFKTNRTQIPALINTLDYFISTGDHDSTRTYYCGN